MTDRNDSRSRRAGRGLMRLLSGLFGRKSVVKARDSARTLGEEFRRGRKESEEEGRDEVRKIPHREVSDPEEPSPPRDDREEPPPAPSAS